MTVINLRGCNGSGKSTVARALLAHGSTEVELAPYTTPRGALRHVLGYRVTALDLVVVGPYRTECGGCDAIKTQDLICGSVYMAHNLARHVFFEGVIVSTLFTRYLGLSRELGGMVWAYLDTPVEVCLARIQARNGGKAIKEELVRNKHRAIARTREKALLENQVIAHVPHDREPALAIEVLLR